MAGKQFIDGSLQGRKLREIWRLVEQAPGVASRCFNQLPITTDPQELQATTGGDEPERAKPTKPNQTEPSLSPSETKTENCSGCFWFSV